MDLSCRCHRWHPGLLGALCNDQPRADDLGHGFSLRHAEHQSPRRLLDGLFVRRNVGALDHFPGVTDRHLNGRAWRLHDLLDVYNGNAAAGGTGRAGEGGSLCRTIRRVRAFGHIFRGLHRTEFVGRIFIGKACSTLSYSDPTCNTPSKTIAGIFR